jgi:hypothetical protein
MSPKVTRKRASLRRRWLVLTNSSRFCTVTSLQGPKSSSRPSLPGTKSSSRPSLPGTKSSPRSCTSLQSTFSSPRSSSSVQSSESNPSLPSTKSCTSSCPSEHPNQLSGVLRGTKYVFCIMWWWNPDSPLDHNSTCNVRRDPVSGFIRSKL